MAEEVEYVERHEVLPSEEIKRRMLEKAALIAELEERNPRQKPETVGLPQPATAQPAKKITVDMSVLHDLVVNARVTSDRAESLEAEYTQARIEAAKARGELDRYTAEHGLR